MISTIQFGLLSTMALDFIDHSDGFLYLRFVGDEATVNAIWAHLSAKETRGQKWSSAIKITTPGGTIPEYVAAQKRVTYRTLRTRLPSGLIDLAMVHPLLTVAEDTERGFYLLTYQDGLPAAFFERLNQSLSIPLKPEWAEWLWNQGQQSQTFQSLETRQVREGAKMVAKTNLIQASETPIRQLKSLGMVAGYRVLCDGRYRDAWLHLIREQLQLRIHLHPELPGQRYTNGDWSVFGFVEPDQSGWRLQQGDEVLLEASTRDYLLAEAQQRLGLNLLIEEEK